MHKESILIVDDDRTTASIMQLHLNNFGYHVADIASSAKEAIEATSYKCVMLGHIHKGQQVKGFQKPVFYSGNPSKLNFGEEGNQSGFYLHKFILFRDLDTES